MTDIVEFLRARYAEEEAVARAAARTAADGDDLSWSGWQLDGQLEEAGWDRPETVNRAAHILRHDPAAVLADIDAKLRILDEHGNINDGDCTTCVTGRWGYPTHGGSDPQLLPCRTLRLLALPFARHDDYLQEWRP